MSDKKLSVIIDGKVIDKNIVPFQIFVGNIKISNPRCGKKGVVHITTGRADSLEGGDFKVSELEIAIQDFFDKNF